MSGLLSTHVTAATRDKLPPSPSADKGPCPSLVFSCLGHLQLAFQEPILLGKVSHPCRDQDLLSPGPNLQPCWVCVSPGRGWGGSVTGCLCPPTHTLNSDWGETFPYLFSSDV